MPVSRQENDENTNQAAETIRNARTVTDEAADAGRHAARAGAEIAQSSAETVQQIVQSGLEMATQATERSVDQFAQVFGFSGRETEKTAQQSSQNIEAVAEATTVLAQGLQDISREWTSLAQNRFQRNLDGLNELLRCRTLPDLVAVQSGLLRENLESMLNNSRRIAEMSVQVASEAARKIAEENANRGRRAA